MNDLGWSRREQPVVNTQRPSGVLGTLAQYNPFGGESYVQLPTHEGEGPGAPLPARTRREEEEGWFARKSETSAAYMLPAVARASAQYRSINYALQRGARSNAGREQVDMTRRLLFAYRCRLLGLICNAGHCCVSSALQASHCDPSKFLQLPRRATGSASRYASP
jgi:hypothetical protein